MNFLNDLCFLCLVPSKNIKSVLSQGDDDIIIEEKLKCVLSELVNFIPEIPKNICSDCLKGLNYVYKFKQKCLQNLISLSDHLKTMTENMSFEHFLSNFTEEQCENDQEKQNGVLVIKNGGNVAVKTDLDDSEMQDESLDETDVYPTEEQSGYFRSAATSTASNQKQANQINSNKTQYKCQECQKVFFCTSLLERHLRTHDIHRYKCTTCQKTFKRPEHLKTHERIHTGEKPYACEVCDKKFAAQSNYISHKRIHANHQPFKCALCDKAFTQSNNLTMHMRVHTGEKPYSCHLCDYKCSQSNNLKIHVRTHTGERPYLCDICNEAFISANHLTQHMRIKHKDYVQ